ncbi:MAG: hypothetical protein KGL54_03990 [Sphingomonadales bacterium]|nr:hypothetical protein [Sphingomonadales bacterium]
MVLPILRTTILLIGGGACLAACTPETSTPDRIGRRAGQALCRSHPPYVAAYTFKPKDTCRRVFRKLNFTSIQELERVNYAIWQFRCPGRAGDLVCYKP